MITLLIDRRCPRCGGWTYFEPDWGPGWWLVCLPCGWEHWLGPGEPAAKSPYRVMKQTHRVYYPKESGAFEADEEPILALSR